MNMGGWMYNHTYVSGAFQFSLYSDDHVKDDGVSSPVVSLVLKSIRLEVGWL